MGQELGEIALTDRLVFNHHCLPCSSAEDMRRHVPEFLKVCLKSQSLGLGTILVTDGLDAGWYRLELAPGYFFQNWSEASREQDRELWRAFTSIATRQPFFSAEDLGADLERFDVLSPIDQSPLPALRACRWFNAPLVSFPTRSPWNDSPVAGLLSSLEDDGELHETLQNFDNIHSLQVLELLEPRLRQERLDSLQSGRDLWNRRAELFPSLDLCGRVQSQVCGWSHPLSVLDQVKTALDAMERLCQDWQTGISASYTHEGLIAKGAGRQVSGESESTNNDSSCRARRTFHTSQGESQYFENHVKFSQGFRMHFYPDAANRIIHVGYIGPHLPTARSS